MATRNGNTNGTSAVLNAETQERVDAAKETVAANAEAAGAANAANAVPTILSPKMKNRLARFVNGFTSVCALADRYASQLAAKMKVKNEAGEEIEVPRFAYTLEQVREAEEDIEAIGASSIETVKVKIGDSTKTIKAPKATTQGLAWARMFLLEFDPTTRTDDRSFILWHGRVLQSICSAMEEDTDTAKQYLIEFCAAVNAPNATRLVARLASAGSKYSQVLDKSRDYDTLRAKVSAASRRK